MKVLRLMAICIIALAASPSIMSAQTIQRPISDYVNAQGQYPSFPFYEIWSASRSSMPECPGGSSNLDPAAYVDYTGYWTAYLATKGISLGTTTSGAIHQSDNGDGTSTVKVELYTANALSFGFCLNSNLPIYLGYTGGEVAAGSPAALASSHFSAVLLIAGTSPTAPLPFLGFIGSCPSAPPCIESVKFTATASGLLGSPYGALAGTPGTLSIEQIGTLKTTGRAATDGFTAEFVTVEPGP